MTIHSRRGLSVRDPIVTLALVIFLAAASFVILRRLGSSSRLRVELLHSLSDLNDAQTGFHRRHGHYAAHVGEVEGDSTIRFIDPNDAQLVITHVDSLGWTATAFNPRVATEPKSCYVYGGGITPHDPRLNDPGVAKCY
jgi:hypothetical protein